MREQCSTLYNGVIYISKTLIRNIFATFLAFLAFLQATGQGPAQNPPIPSFLLLPVKASEAAPYIT